MTAKAACKEASHLFAADEVLEDVTRVKRGSYIRIEVHRLRLGQLGALSRRQALGAGLHALGSQTQQVVHSTCV
jgi:hypothetical protein